MTILVETKTSSLKHNANSLHSYMYDEYGMLYDNNPSQGGKITLGNMDASNFTQSHNDYTFQAKEYDSESALNYFGARYLDSFSGTWTTNDIVRGNLVEPETQHRSNYVHDNPVNLIDRYGYSAVGNSQGNFTLPQNLSGKQNYVNLPKTTIQGNTAGTLAEQFRVGNVNNQGSVLNKNPLSSNTNWGSQITNTFSTMFKNSQINQVINAFTSPMAERHHRAFALLGLITGTNLQELLPANIRTWLEDWIDGDEGVSSKIVVPKIEENVDYGKYNVASGLLHDSLEKFAESLNQNIIITSGDRSSEKNKSIGGATSSRHISGDAADMRVTNINNEELAYLANKSELFNTTIYYPKIDLPGVLSPHVHVDLNPNNNNILLIYTPFMKNGYIKHSYSPMINPLIINKP